MPPTAASAIRCTITLLMSPTGTEASGARLAPGPHLPREGAGRSERKRQPRSSLLAPRPSPFAPLWPGSTRKGGPLSGPPYRRRELGGLSKDWQPGAPRTLEVDHAPHRVGVGGPVRSVPPGHLHHCQTKRLPAIPVPVERGQVSGTAHQVTRLWMPTYRPVVWLTPPAGRDPHRSAVEGSNVLQGQDESQRDGSSPAARATELVPGKVRDPPIHHRGASSRGREVRSHRRSMDRVNASSRDSSRTSR